MKTSLLRDIIRYAKTKGKAPLDERQMDTLKDLYMELAKSVILAFCLEPSPIIICFAPVISRLSALMSILKFLSFRHSDSLHHCL